jgi:hypothetical protein
MEKNLTAPAERKPYVAPTVVCHGDAADKTRGGIMGRYTELWGWSWYGTQPGY